MLEEVGSTVGQMEDYTGEIFWFRWEIVQPAVNSHGMMGSSTTDVALCA
jgi:hypothetical protein